MYHKIFKTFLDPVLEEQYQQRAQRSIKRILYFIYIITIVNSVLLIFSDLLILEYDFSLTHPVFFSRIFQIIICFSLLYVIKSTSKTNLLNATMIIYFTFLVITTFIAHYLNPKPQEIAYSLEAFIILVIYLVVPLNLKIQSFGAITFSLSLWSSLHRDPVESSFVFQIIIVIITANIVGFAISRFFSSTVREMHIRFINTKKMRVDLEVAIQDIRLVQGIIPICASCKKIRDDSGFWNQLEPYLKKITNADLVGQKCPKCIDRENL